MAKRKRGRPKDPLALTEKILVRILPATKRRLERMALKGKRRLATWIRERLEVMAG